MIDHTGFHVSNFEESKAFYSAALKPLGYEVVMELNFEGHLIAGLGEGGKPDFWLTTKSPVTLPMHIAFLAKNRAQVDAFFAAALAVGAKDNGKPGIRELYHPNYYGAFVIGPDGHNIEAVCHASE